MVRDTRYSYVRVVAGVEVGDSLEKTAYGVRVVEAERNAQECRLRRRLSNESVTVAAGMQGLTT